MTCCLVTGGAGFIGSHLVEALVRRGDRVRVLDDFSTGQRNNLAGVRDRIELIEGDISDLDTVRRACAGVEVVYHQAALASVPRSVADPLPTHRVGATGTLHVLVAAREAGVRRVVYAGSSSAYGNNPTLPRREHDPLQPLSPYAVAKLTGEQYCAAFTHVYGLETVRLRYFNVFGPRQRPDSPYAAVIPKFVDALLAGRNPTVHGDGLQSRDFSYIDNVVDANQRAAEALGVGGRVYNIACGGRYSLLELLTVLNELLGTHIPPVHTDPRPGDVKHSQADISRARADLGYEPHIGWREGLERTVRSYVAQHQGGPSSRTAAR